jgi:anti-anti-sigma factor
MTISDQAPSGSSPARPTRTPAPSDDSDAIQDGQLATFDLVVRGDETILRVAGELDMSNSRTLAAMLPERGEAHRSAGVRMVIDLTAVTFLDSSALHELLTLQERHGPVTVRASAVVQRLLDLTVPGQFTTTS